MSAKSISHCKGKGGSLAHNNRKFTPKNVDSSRTCNNITFVKQPLDEAYEKCFGEAVQRYNNKQNRNDRKINTSYFENLFNRPPSDSILTATSKHKSFYEDIIQIGTKDDTGVGTADGQIATECLTEYMEGFSKRNPNMYVFNAVIHLDEATPHLHMDYIPIGHYKRGIDTQNGLAQALKEQGFVGADAINKWRLSERAVLESICNKRGIEISEPKKSRGFSFTVDSYKEYKDTIAKFEKQADEVKEQVNKINSNRNFVISELFKLDDEFSKLCEDVDIKKKELEQADDELVQVLKKIQEKEKNFGRLNDLLEKKEKYLSKLVADAALSENEIKQAEAKLHEINEELDVKSNKLVEITEKHDFISDMYSEVVTSLHEELYITDDYGEVDITSYFVTDRIKELKLECKNLQENSLLEKERLKQLKDTNKKLEYKKDAIENTIKELEKEIELKCNKMLLDAQKEAQGIKDTLAPQKIEYEAHKAFLERAVYDSDVSVMYPDYVKVNKSLIGGKETVTVPKDKWESKHIASNYIDVLRDAQKKFDTEIQSLGTLKFDLEDSKKINENLNKELSHLSKELSALKNLNTELGIYKSAFSALSTEEQIEALAIGFKDKMSDEELIRLIIKLDYNVNDISKALKIPAALISKTVQKVLNMDR